MAFMNQDRKKVLAVHLKKAMAGYNIKYTLGVNHHSTIVMRITEGDLDIIGNAQAVNDSHPNPDRHRNSRGNGPATHLSVNNYYIDDHYTGVVKEMLSAANAALSVGNHDRSDIQSDYFDVGWYISISVGTWDKPYKLVN